MKTIVIQFCLALFVGTSLFAQINDESSTTVKTMNPDGASSIVFDMNYANLLTEKWDSKGDLIRIELEIRANMPTPILKKLVKAGRYKLIGSKDGEKFVITAPNLDKHVTVGGQTLQEKVFVHVKSPIMYTIEEKKLTKYISPDVIAGITGREGSAAAVDAAIKKMKKINSQIEIVTEVKLVSTLPSSLSQEKASKKGLSKGKRAKKNREESKAKTFNYGEIIIDDIPLEFD
jgi:hypothetical protein